MDLTLTENNIGIFKQDAERFAQIDKLISESQKMLKPIQEKIKQLKMERKELEQELCMTMGANDIGVAELENNKGKLEYISKTAIVPVTQKIVKSKMLDFFEMGPGSELSFNSMKPSQKGEAMFDYIYHKENREYVKKESIKSKDLA